MGIVRSSLNNDNFQYERLNQLSDLLHRICSSNRIVWVLLVLGVIRAALVLMAYPPAHQSDSDLFFLYAERLHHLSDWAMLDDVTYPAYPFLILITYKWFGSVYVLIAVQMVMSVLIAPMYYLAIRMYSPILASIISIVTIFDMQSASSYNFANAEPLYMFLMGLTLMIYLRQIAPGARKSWSMADGLTGVMMMLLWLTRTIGRYLIWPYAVIFFVYTRDWKRTATMLVGFVISLGVYSLISTLALGQVAGLNATDYAFARVMRHHPDWVVGENGPNTVLWLEAIEGCEPPSQFHQAYCLYEMMGTWGEAENVIRGAAVETVKPHLADYAAEVWESLLNFMSLSAEVYNQTSVIPSTIQCDAAEEKTARLTPEFLDEMIYRPIMPVLAFEGEELEREMTRYREIMGEINTVFCPPLPDSPQVRSVVNLFMSLNRVFGRSNPHIWYGVLLVLVFLIPWARRLVPVVLIAGGTLITLGISPAMLSVADNPRYAIPTNSLRIILLCALVFIVMKWAVMIFDRVISSRR